MRKGYSRSGDEARSPKNLGAAGLVGDKLEEIARQGAQRMLADALEMEVDEFLQRTRYARGQAFRGYRNGHAPERAIGIGMGQVQIRTPTSTATRSRTPTRTLTPAVNCLLLPRVVKGLE